jgi:hypothetical protein
MPDYNEIVTTYPLPLSVYSSSDNTQLRALVFSALAS